METINACEECGAPRPPRARRYCGRACNLTAARRAAEAVDRSEAGEATPCDYCGGPSPRHKQRGTVRRYCSRSCSMKHGARESKRRKRATDPEWVERHREEVREYHRTKVTPEKRREWRQRSYDPDREALRRHARRAAMRGVDAEPIVPTEVYERDGWTCQLCHEPLDREAPGRSSRAPSLDHVIPLVKGGTHTLDNVQSAHYGCNSAKRDRILTNV